LKLAAIKRWLAGSGPRWISLIAVMVFVELVYVFVVSAGHWTNWPTYIQFLDDQAEGFRAGHLHMIVEPAPGLLAMANPFDHAHRPLWYWDASLYKGHYYTYWGPVPFALLALVKTMFRISTVVGDQWPVFFLVNLQFFAGVALLHRIKRHLFPNLHYGFVIMGVLAFGFANPTLYLLARGGVYESAIVGGHAFVVLGLVFAFEAVWRAAVAGPIPPRLPRGLLATAGSCWALALGCRVSIIPALSLLVLLTGLFAAGSGLGRWRRFVRATLWAGVPCAIGMLGLLAYNKARFDSWFDFGWRHQMSWIPSKLSAAFVLPNAFSYALRPVLSSCKFPFFTSVEGMGPRAFPGWFPLPDGYGVAEPVAGVLIAIPWSWLGLVALAATLSALRRWRTSSTDPRTVALSWATLSSAIVVGASLLLGLGFFSATMRYLGDVVGGVALAGTLGAWLLVDRFAARAVARRLVAVACAGLLGATMVLSLAQGFNGQYRHFERMNPELMRRLQAKFSVCGSPGSSR
jgi:hypothetical protein